MVSWFYSSWTFLVRFHFTTSFASSFVHFVLCHCVYVKIAGSHAYTTDSRTVNGDFVNPKKCTIFKSAPPFHKRWISFLCQWKTMSKSDRILLHFSCSYFWLQQFGQSFSYIYILWPYDTCCYLRRVRLFFLWPKHKAIVGVVFHLTIKYSASKSDPYHTSHQMSNECCLIIRLITENHT